MEELTVQASVSTSRMSPVRPSINSRLGQDRLHQKDAAKQPAKKAEENAVKESVSPSELVKEINDFVQRVGTKISFSYDPHSKEAHIIVTEKETGKIIREIPPKELVDLKRKMKELAGVIFDEQV